MSEETREELAVKFLRSFEKGIIPEDEKQEELPFIIVEDEGRQCVVKVEDNSNVMCYEGEDALESAGVLLSTLNMLEIGEEIEEESVHLDDDEEDEDKNEGKQFSDEPWDGAASRWDTADAYCEDTLIDVNPSGEDKIKGLCKLPFRDPGTTTPNINAVRAIGGGNGITATEKPASVSQEEWDSQLKSAADRVITWWPEAFDTEAPEGVFRIAGRERPEEDEAQVSERKDKQLSGNGLIAKLKGAATALGDFLAGVENEEKQIFGNIVMFDTPSGFAVKTVGDKSYHFTWSTNAFEDREGEIFSTKALEQYVFENDEKEQEAKKRGEKYHRGFFNLWHINEDNSGLNSDFAEKEWQGVIGRFLVEFGPYLDSNKGQNALKFFKKYPDGHPEFSPEGWGCSPEFKFLPEERETGVFDWLFITKTSTLPRAVAANIWTGAKQKENVMTVTKDQEKLYIEALGKEDFEATVKEGENRTKKLEAAKIAHKENEPEVEVNIEELINKRLPTLEKIAQEVSKQFSEDREPLMKVIASLENGMKELQDKVVQLEKHIEVKQAVETPRYILGMQRASESAETVVSEGDGLKDKKPQESENKNPDSASHFFGSK